MDEGTTCTCGFPHNPEIQHNTDGKPCSIRDPKNSAAPVGLGLAPVAHVEGSFQVARPDTHTALMVDRDALAALPPLPDLLTGIDLWKEDPQYLDVTQEEITRRVQDAVAGYERRIANMAQVIQNLSGSHQRLVNLRTAVDTVVNEVEAVAAKSTNDTAKGNYRIITLFLRKAADAAADPEQG